jgi:hypothetical protein
MPGCILVAVTAATINPRIIAYDYANLRMMVSGPAANVYYCDKNKPLAIKPVVITRTSGLREYVWKQ